MTATPRVSVVVLAYGDEPLLERCVSAALASSAVLVRVVLVDNGCRDQDVVAALGARPSVTIIEPGGNLGFAAGVNLGVSHSTDEYVVLLNSDAVPSPDAVAMMVQALSDPQVGLVTSSLRLMRQPDRMNSCGNPVHFTGVSWAGGFGDEASRHTARTEVASASGAALACRRSTWDRLGGLREPMFAYHEDTDLSLRCWLIGLTVVYEPQAVVLHDYEFSRNDRKLGLLERNRLITVLTVFDGRTLVAVAPFLIMFEVAVSLLAVRERWFGKKISGWIWLLRNLRWVLDCRDQVQATRVRPDSVLVELLTGTVEPGQQFGGFSLRVFNHCSSLYWSIARSVVRAADQRRLRSADGTR